MATHDDLQLGLIETETVWVAISADSVSGDADAVLLACQMAHSYCILNGMPTGARLLSWPETRSTVAGGQQAGDMINRAQRPS